MKRRTIREAIIETLTRNGNALATKEIYSYIIKHDLYRFNAEYPENIVRIEIRRHCVGVDFPSAKPNKFFQILLDGRYWLKDIPVPGLSDSYLKSENAVRKETEIVKSIVSELKDIHDKHTIAFKTQVLNQLKEIHPKTFESFGKKLLDVYGFKEVKVTKYIKDGGLDGFGKLKVGITHLNVAFQCKRWKTNSVSRTEIDKFRGAIQGEFEQGIIFTTSTFSREALNATRKSGAVPIILIDGNALIDIMIEKKFGIAIDNLPVYVNALDEVLNDEVD